MDLLLADGFERSKKQAKYFACVRCDILRRCRKVILLPLVAVIFFRLKLREAQYHSASAEYNCEAIYLAEGE